MSEASSWPAVPISEWRDTRDTLHLWLQVIGKIRMANTPPVNHWWNVPLYLTSRGLTTSLMHHESGQSFQIDLDLCDHRLIISTTTGLRREMPLTAQPVRDFHQQVMSHLDVLGLPTKIWPMPVEIPGPVRPFDQDDVHQTYDPEHAHRFWLALVAMVPVFAEFRGRFLGKASPIHLFWGGLDLATTRFSGRRAPAYQGTTPNCGPQVMREAYSHQVSSCGYWPDGGPEGVFYSYAYPEPAGFRERMVLPVEASWSARFEEFLLPYDVVREAADPEHTLLSFLQSTYDAAADAAGWNRLALERPTTPTNSRTPAMHRRTR